MTTPAPPSADDALPMPLSWGVDVVDVPVNGMQITKTATEAERTALADALDLVSCEALTATYRVSRMAGDGYKVRGKLTADVVQACVVTLAPVHETVAAAYAVEFVPAKEAVEAAQGGAVDLEEDVELEPIDGTTLAIGRVVFEELAAALNPYPRRPGAEYASSPAAAGTSEARPDTPFAVLAKLKAGKTESGA